MGCTESQEVYEPPKKSTSTGGYKPREISPEELERRKREKEEEQKWFEIAKSKADPAPPKPVPKQGLSEDEYKQYMREKYDYEAWENSVILLSRKLRKEADPSWEG
eukprot:TRINITY_DN51245_c0_g1_i1.p1 TRINITY_DN51245_c0_g1~~TRINITY_DN51245_c0_g1_i1.p1  ORF type:complete len:106 (+),score=23.68 TRINITY_DN51245_c0_g1_i1:38-355(+)